MIDLVTGSSPRCSLASLSRWVEWRPSDDESGVALLDDLGQPWRPDGCPRLEVLSANGSTRINDAAAPALRAMPRLRWVDLATAPRGASPARGRAAGGECPEHSIPAEPPP